MVRAIRAAGGEVIGRRCDVSDPSAVAALVHATEQAFGGVQIVWTVWIDRSADGVGSCHRQELTLTLPASIARSLLP